MIELELPVAAVPSSAVYASYQATTGGMVVPMLALQAIPMPHA